MATPYAPKYSYHFHPICPLFDPWIAPTAPSGTYQQPSDPLDDLLYTNEDIFGASSDKPQEWSLPPPLFNFDKKGEKSTMDGIRSQFGIRSYFIILCLWKQLCHVITLCHFSVCYNLDIWHYGLYFSCFDMEWMFYMVFYVFVIVHIFL